MKQLIEGPPVREEDLQAYVDGQLDMARHCVVAAYLAREPREAARLETYRRQNQILRAFADASARDEPPAVLTRLYARLQRSIGRQRRARQAAWWAAAACATLVLSIGLWSDRSEIATAEESSLSDFARVVADHHVAFGDDASPPYTITGVHGGNALFGWLSERAINAARDAPDLTGLGIVLGGGRLFMVDGNPVIQLIYEDERKGRLSLYVGSSSAIDEPIRFDVLRQPDTTSFLWHRSAFNYGLVARSNRDDLLQVAHTVDAQVRALARPVDAVGQPAGPSTPDAATPRRTDKETRPAAGSAGDTVPGGDDAATERPGNGKQPDPPKESRRVDPTPAPTVARARLAPSRRTSASADGDRRAPLRNTVPA